MINTSNSKEYLCGLKRADFQKTVQGKQTDLFVLKNKNGAELAVTNYGGAVAALMMPDKNGQFANVIQGHDSIDHVINSHEPFLSTLVGRYGNRIEKGKFLLNGKEYQLAINNGPNHLHGGPTGFHARVWDAEQTNEQTLKLHYVSADGEEGFPGKLEVHVEYQLSDDNEFIIKYSATTDKKTICNMTHHGFYSLSGLDNPTATIDNNIVTINADYYLPIDNTSIPFGDVAKVEGTPFDFRTPHVVGCRIDDKIQQIEFGAGYDHCFVLNKREAGSLTFAAKCVEPNSGRVMEVYTTEPGVQVYTSNWHNGFAGWHGTTFPRRSAICFEAQHFPDTPNKGHFPSCVLNPGEEYKQTTIYKFSIEK
ncbi:MAG: aldose epimerase family protein [Phocaeicola sp.]|uniref:aldose epimerase family protein n=1 Tax=Phocaeicola sp. TaxID=2773926 RepID=UPI003FA08445